MDNYYDGEQEARDIERLADRFKQPLEKPPIKVNIISGWIVKGNLAILYKDKNIIKIVPYKP
jgi:hypothetical protein